MLDLGTEVAPLTSLPQPRKENSGRPSGQPQEPSCRRRGLRQPVWRRDSFDVWRLWVTSFAGPVGARRSPTPPRPRRHIPDAGFSAADCTGL